MFPLSLYTGELHLTPVSNIVQFRPSFNYLDQADAKMKKKTDKENGEGKAIPV